jgi:hypothetical protein
MSHALILEIDSKFVKEYLRPRAPKTVEVRKLNGFSIDQIDKLRDVTALVFVQGTQVVGIGRFSKTTKGSPQAIWNKWGKQIKCTPGWYRRYMGGYRSNVYAFIDVKFVPVDRELVLPLNWWHERFDANDGQSWLEIYDKEKGK